MGGYSSFMEAGPSSGQLVLDLVGAALGSVQVWSATAS